MGMSLGLPTFALNSTAISSGTVVPASFTQPYGPYYSDLGDSRTVQNYASSGPATYVGLFTDNKLRPSPTWNKGGTFGKGGIGGQNAVDAVAWPRNAGNIWTNCSLASNGNGTATLTVNSGGGGGDNWSVGVYLSGAGLTARTYKVTALGTGTGNTGTYIVTPDTGTIAGPQSIRPVYYDTKTIAEVAADQAATVVILLGTNGAGATTETAAVVQAIAGLTTPGSAYPGYRPNNESTDQPLPLYNGLAKNIILVDELRKGVTYQNVASNGADNTALHTHALTLDKYHYASGDPLANSRVYVARCFDDPTIANLSSATSGNPSYLPKAGYFVDGLHCTGVLSWWIGNIIGQGNTADGFTSAGLSSLLTSFNSTANLADTTNYTSNAYLNSNSCFVLADQTGGTVSSFTSSGGTLTNGTSNLPRGFDFRGTNCTGLSLDVSYNALSGNDGYELVLRLHGTPTADGSFTLFGSNATSAKRLLIQATDNVRLAYRERRNIVSGLIRDCRGAMVTPTSAISVKTYGAGGLYTGTDRTTMMLLNNIQNSGLNGGTNDPNAAANSSTYFVPQTDDATGNTNPANAAVQYAINWYTGQDIDMYVYLSRVTLSRN
jgi:hypothetical protein